MSVDALYPPGTGKAVIASVGECDSGSGNLNQVLIHVCMEHDDFIDIPCSLDPWRTQR